MVGKNKFIIKQPPIFSGVFLIPGSAVIRAFYVYATVSPTASRKMAIRVVYGSYTWPHGYIFRPDYDRNYDPEKHRTRFKPVYRPIQLFFFLPFPTIDPTKTTAFLSLLRGQNIPICHSHPIGTRDPDFQDYVNHFDFRAVF